MSCKIKTHITLSSVLDRCAEDIDHDTVRLADIGDVDVHAEPMNFRRSTGVPFCSFGLDAVGIWWTAVWTNRCDRHLRRSEYLKNTSDSTIFPLSMTATLLQII